MPLPCPECKREFSIKSNLTRHIRMVHNLHVERIDILPASFDVYHYKCLEGCNVSFKYNRDLRSHLRMKHELDLVEMNLEFPNSEEFTKWLYTEEANNCVQYVHLTATKKKSTGAETFYYECSRTGKRNHLDESVRKRRPKKHGTQKLNRGCTSQIIVNKSHDGSYSVNYFKTHYGHEIDLEHIKLSKQDRGIIASKLLLGVSVSSVLHSVQNKSGDLKRINLLRRKDVFNIKKSFNIALKDGKLANVDAININSFINECSKHLYNPILHHNLQDYAVSDDVCLIMMSKYQSEVLLECANDNIIVINSAVLNNCDFELTSLFVVYENGESFPGACMFSNKKHLSVYELFFNKIKEKIGVIKPATFISNVSEIYYEAWRNTMGEVTYDLYSPVQIDLDWKLNLNRISCLEADVTKVKRKWVYDTLKILQNISEENEFIDNFEETIKLLDGDVDFKDFLQYFLENYNNPKKWANCFRLNCNLGSIHLELINDILKQYLNWEKENRFDKIFHSLIRFIRDETVNCMIKTKAARVLFVSENDSRHHTSTMKTFNIEYVSEDIWNVTDEVTMSVYVIQRHLQKKCCNLSCTVCRICIHCFSCTCVDFFVSNAICAHIHYIWVTYFQSIVSNEEEDDEGEEQQEFFDEEIIIEIDDDTEVNNDNIKLLQDEIVAKTSALSENISNMQCETSLRFILDSVNSLCEFAVSPNNNFVTENREQAELKDTVLNDHSYL